MRLRKRKISGRERDEASIKLLEQLRERLYSDDASGARRAAFNLSWMQEDGLDILKEALFGRAAKRTKGAAAYGLRKVHGRMKKMALEVFKQGLAHPDRNTRDVCRGALSLVVEKAQEKAPSEAPSEVGKFKIREISRKRGQKREVRKRPRAGHLLPDEDSSRR
jgi:hypothetical protein